jgi:hypothetical protein
MEVFDVSRTALIFASPCGASETSGTPGTVGTHVFGRVDNLSKPAQWAMIIDSICYLP